MAWAARLKSRSYALYLAVQDPRVPLLAKVLIFAAIAYAVSPVDLIPDFVPVLGYLDDLVLLPILVWAAIRLVPTQVWQECCARAERATDRSIPVARRWIWLATGLWLAVLAALSWVFWLAWRV